MSESKGRPVLVTTQYRGVFFGYLEGEAGETVKLKDARLCVYWSRDVRGFMGLASSGPTDECRIGPAVDVELRAVTAIVEMKPEAVARMEAAPWAP